MDPSYVDMFTKKIYDVSCGDRFIPLRKYNDWSNFTIDEEEASTVYDCMVKNEVAGTSYECVFPEKKNFFTYKERKQKKNLMRKSSSTLSYESELVLNSKLDTEKKPYKVTRFKGLKKNFYLNLLDWSICDVPVVGVNKSFFLINTKTFKIEEFKCLKVDTITSIAWSECGNLLAIGTAKGLVKIWNVEMNKCVSTAMCHSGEIGVLAWNGNVLASGGQDHDIMQRDLRMHSSKLCLLKGHKRQVCGLAWSLDRKNLASGGNDKCLYVWEMNNTRPLQTYIHNAAVKGIAWSPDQHGLIASSSGYNDQCIYFWNALKRTTKIKRIHTRSQVTNLAWIKSSTVWCPGSQLVSTHGYDSNKISVWNYPSLNEVSEIYGHSDRILYLGVSPDCEKIMTGDADETVKFWKLSKTIKNKKSALDLNICIR
jgi:cell division cycle 20-like protein 1 (cofactor of APC complex)